MMNRRLYAIRDLKAAIFNPPTIMDNDAVAVRSFGDLVTKGNDTLFAVHPSDFAVCYIGDFDIEKGNLIPAEGGFVMLAVGSDFLAPTKPIKKGKK